VLARRKFEMERDLQRAQGTDFADTVTDRVSIGTTVDLVDCASAAEERFSILGAWDTDLTRHIISYLSITGAALLGRTVGDEVDLPTEESNISRRVRITAIDKAEIPS
jgi:transcription elongation factor GreA